MEPIGRCHLHGGETPVGPASPHWKHGKYSRHRSLPQRLIPMLEASLQDADLYNLRQEIAALDARIDDLEQRVDTGESGETWKALLDAARALEKAQSKANFVPDSRKAEAVLEVSQALETLQDLCREGTSDYQAWSEVTSLWMLRAKLVEADSKRRATMKTDVPVEKVAYFFQELEARVNTDVKDPDSLRAISRILRDLSPGLRPET